MEKISSPNFSVLKMVLQINGVLPSSFSEVEFAELDDCLLVGRVCFYRLLQQDSTLRLEPGREGREGEAGRRRGTEFVKKRERDAPTLSVVAGF